MALLDDLASVDMDAPVKKTAPAPTGNALLDSLQNTDMNAPAGATSNAPASAAPQPGGTGFLPSLIASLGQFGAGVNHSLAGTIGGLPDLVGSGLSALGVPGIQPGYFTHAAQSGLDAITGQAPEPQGLGQNLMRGAGQGLGDAASVMLPAAALSRVSSLGPVVQSAMQSLASSPGLQVASGMTGGAVGQATGSPTLGMAASMLPLVPSTMGAAARGAVGMTSPPITPELQRLMAVAQQDRIPLTTGQQLNSRPLKTLESVFETLPFSAREAAVQRQTQQTALNSAALRRAGQSEQFATPQVLQATRDDIGTRLNDIAARNTMQVPTTLAADVQALAANAARYLPRDVARPVLARIEDFTNLIAAHNPPPTIPPNGRMTAAQYQAMLRGQPVGPITIPGQAYANLDSALGRQMRGTTDGNARQALGDLRDTLRAGMDASISGADAQAWQQARTQYAHLMTIAKAMNHPSAITASGNIPPAALAHAANNTPMKSNAFGYGDMRDLGAVGQAFIKDQVPNSGTPERAAIMGLLGGATGGIGGALMNGGLGAALGAAAVPAATLALPRLAQMLYNGPGRGLLTGPGGAINPGLLGALALQKTRQQLQGPTQQSLDPASQMILQLSQ